MNPPTAQEAREFFGKPTELDYPEDFADDNGQYLHTCHACERRFVGHKDRIQCKPCQETSAAEWAKMPEEERSRIIEGKRFENHSGNWIKVEWVCGGHVSYNASGGIQWDGGRLRCTRAKFVSILQSGNYIQAK